METYFPHNAKEHQNWGPVVGSQCVEPHTQPVVEVPHGHSSSFLGSSRGAEQATMTISCAPLGRIRMDNTRKETSGFSGNGYDSHRELSNIEIDPNHGSSAKVRCTTVLQGGYSRHTEVYDHMETRLDSFQKPFEEDGMEYGGVSDNEC
nr:hypothetical protein CFP56_59012 [Quercus suber]